MFNFLPTKKLNFIKSSSRLTATKHNGLTNIYIVTTLTELHSLSRASIFELLIEKNYSSPVEGPEKAGALYTFLGLLDVS